MILTRGGINFLRIEINKEVIKSTNMTPALIAIAFSILFVMARAEQIPSVVEQTGWSDHIPFFSTL